MSGNFHPTPPPRSPWSSPIVIGAIVAGVLVLALAVLLGFLLIPSDDSSSDAGRSSTASTTTTNPPVSTRTVTADPSTVTATSTVTPTTTTTRPDGRVPDVPGADRQGFVSGPRCNATGDPVVMVGQTDRSKVIVCQVGNQTGRYYYKGLAGGMGTEIGYPTRSGNQFVAVNGDTTYQMTPSSLTITTNGMVVSAEPMLFYWTD